MLTRLKIMKTRMLKLSAQFSWPSIIARIHQHFYTKQGLMELLEGYGTYKDDSRRSSSDIDDSSSSSSSSSTCDDSSSTSSKVREETAIIKSNQEETTEKETIAESDDTAQLQAFGGMDSFQLAVAGNATQDWSPTATAIAFEMTKCTRFITKHYLAQEDFMATHEYDECMDYCGIFSASDTIDPEPPENKCDTTTKTLPNKSKASRTTTMSTEANSVSVSNSPVDTTTQANPKRTTRKALPLSVSS